MTSLMLGAGTGTVPTAFITFYLFLLEERVVLLFRV